MVIRYLDPSGRRSTGVLAFTGSTTCYVHRD